MYSEKCQSWNDFITFLLNVLQEFFGQLDQRVLNAFLKACDELTDILPEQEQQNLQETVRKLHKQWKVRERLQQGYSNLTREIHFPAEFSSNPNQTHLSMLIRVFMIIRKSQVGESDQGWS